jgi:hypothetical protein
MVESCPVLDADHLSAAGRLTPGWSGVCQCVDDVGACSIHLHAEAERLRLSWANLRLDAASNATSDAAGDGKHGVEGATEIIPIVRMSCHYGGDRPYFLCPGCGRQLTKLYLVNRCFLCRYCHRLVYASNYESVYKRPWQQALRRVGRLRQRFGTTTQGLDSTRISMGIGTVDVPERPRWMHVDTYTRLLDELLQAEMQAAKAGAAQLQHLAAQVEASARCKPRLFTL